MSVRTRLIHIRNQRERRLGWIIVITALIFIALAIWSWLETFYYKRQLFDLYFSETVQGLSVGADVITEGQTIGQVQGIRLRTLSDDGTSMNYAVVTIYADFRSLWNISRIEDDSEEFQERIRREIKNGLRTRLFMRSLISNGLSVEIFFDPEKPAVFVNDPECKNIELPTISKTLSQHIDHINDVFKKYKLDELVPKMREAEQHISHLNAQLDAIDFPALNTQALRKTESLKNSLANATFLKKVDELNRSLEALASVLESGEENAESLFENAALQLRHFSESARKIRKQLPTPEQIDPEALMRLRNNLENYRRILNDYTEKLRQTTLPAQ